MQTDRMWLMDFWSVVLQRKHLISIKNLLPHFANVSLEYVSLLLSKCLPIPEYWTNEAGDGEFNTLGSVPFTLSNYWYVQSLSFLVENEKISKEIETGRIKLSGIFYANASRLHYNLKFH